MDSKLKLLGLDDKINENIRKELNEEVLDVIYKGNFNNIIKKLNEKQKEAVLYKEGPLMIESVAGSGKTKVIVVRIFSLIYNYDIKPSEIVAVTFTNKAGKEMKSRLSKMFPQEISSQILVGTFHHICCLFLRKYAKFDFTIIDENDKLKFIRDLAKKRVPNDDDFKLIDFKHIVNKISYAKNHKISPAKMMASLLQDFKMKTEHMQFTADIYMDYALFMKERKYYDYDDLILNCVVLMGKDKIFKNRIANDFKYILVDEFQDTNDLQYEFLEFITCKHKNITVVGDTDQAIYGFRFATFENVNKFIKNFENTKIVMLEENYRSTKNILACCYAVISDSKQKRTDKKLRTSNVEGDKVIVYNSFNPDNEADYVIKEIKKVMKEKSYGYKDFAVLYRMKAQTRVLEETFQGYKMPYKLRHEFSFYDRKEIKDLIAYLTLINTASNKQIDALSFERCITVPKKGIGVKYLEKIMEIIKNGQDNKIPISFTELCEKVKDDSEIDLPNNVKLKTRALCDLIETYKTQISESSMKPKDVILELLEAIAYKQYLLVSDESTYQTRWENVSELVNVLSKYETLNKFLDDIFTLSENEVDNDANRDAVTLSTIHSIKGLEYKCVFVIGVETGTIPHYLTLKNDKELEEERRLLYVAMTRAEKLLYLTYNQERLNFGKKIKSKKSFFVRDLPRNSILELSDDTIKNNNPNEYLFINY